MKKLIVLTLILFTAFSCGDEVEFNTPAFQGDRANELWRASAFSASIDANGFLTITGTNNVETVTLRVPSVIVKPEDDPFVVGDVDSIEAEYIDAFGTVYTTNNRPDETVSVYPELGEIWIDEIDVVSNTLTGGFRFLAFDASGLNSVGYTNGMFFKVPIISGSIPANPITCEDAEALTQIAAQAYNDATSGGSTGFYNSVAFETVCSAYVDALNHQMAYCGDVDGALQALINNLGDCMYTCDFALANVVEAENQFTTSTMGNYITNCNQYAQYLQEQITYCGDADGSIQAIIDGLDCADDDNDMAPNVFEDFNGDGNLTNDDSDNDLNPNYLDNDDDDDGVPTASELMFDADGNPIDTDGNGQADYFDSDDDGDGVDTTDEDLDGDGNPANDDTDGDGTPNYLDKDDDGDGVLSVYEDVNGDGDLTNDDTDGDGIPNYLDNDDDGDSVLTQYEGADPDADGNPMDANNFDGDLLPDYLDNDDDNDGALTVDENPDPNGDGNPDDAANTDADAAPDYLDAM